MRRQAEGEDDADGKADGEHDALANGGGTAGDERKKTTAYRPAAPVVIDPTQLVGRRVDLGDGRTGYIERSGHGFYDVKVSQLRPCVETVR